MKAVTISDVAKHAGTSKSTVSQFLNERFDYMREDTKKRIEVAIEELGYSPNIVARSLKMKSTKTIGVIVANILHVFSTQVIRSIEDFCNESNFHVIVCNADDDPVKEKRYIDMLRAKQVDGIIAFPTGGNVDLYKRLVSEKYPIVFMDRMIPELPINTVLLDNEKASKLAVDAFLQKGHDQIGMISPSLGKCITPRMERINGYKNALLDHQIPFKQEYLVSAEIPHIQSVLETMLGSPNRPQALLALNDRVLFEILKYTKEHQIRIPEDLAVIGIDDVSFANFYSPALTTVAQPAFEMGKKAAELLLTRISNKESEVEAEIFRFEPQLIKRSSC
ncbi:LacI family DNA-binding transcriptional regulator [Virgibacillus byunsanensis]|uniref:LacI family DNA-binding transcriptional regulator n=1 Tax=Virgibacillus byunsanensis TaxID=570945 RepID=A0ABW3LGQ6_9BACI